MQKELRDYIKNLKEGIAIMEAMPQTENTKGQIEMARCVVYDLQRIVLGLK